MISTDFAPNEFLDDALSSLITLLFPWRYMSGPNGEKARSLLEEVFPDAHATFFLSGRGSLSSVLHGLRIKKGSEAIVQGFTCEAVVLPIRKKGLVPVYADIEKDTFSLDFDSLKDNITPRTKLIILQHTFGLVPKHRDRVLRLAKEKNIAVIEDLAHGFEPDFWQKQKLSDKQVLLLSFGRSKALSSVFGGAVVTSDRGIEAELRLYEARLPYPSMGFVARLLCYKPITYLAKKTYNFLGFGKLLHYFAKRSGLLVAEISQKEKGGLYDGYLEKKYPDALAKLLVVQLEKYARTVGQRRRIAEEYKRSFPLSSSSVPTRYPVLTENKENTLNDVSKLHIFLGNWYSQPVAPQELKLFSVGYTMGSCPTAEEVCGKIINLPTLVSYKEAQKIISILHLTK